MALAGALCLTVHAIAGFNNRSLRALVGELLGTTYTATQMTYDLRRLRLHGLIGRLPRSNTYFLTPKGIRVALFYTKVHDRLLTPLLAAHQPPAPLPIRRALHVIDQTVDSYVDHARIAQLPEKLVTTSRERVPEEPYAGFGTRPKTSGPRRGKSLYPDGLADDFSERYSDLLEGSYDCVDRIVLNAFTLGHSAGGFREWWRRLNNGSEDELDNAHLMRMAGRFSRRVHGFARAHNIPIIDCRRGERKHRIAEEYLATHSVKRGLFLILVGRAMASVWDVQRSAQGLVQNLEKKRPYINHYSFHIMDPEWGHITIKIAGHPPFGAQIILNGHEYVACQERKRQLAFTKEGNCFTHLADPARLAKIADTLADKRTIGRIIQVCEQWIYSACLCFALDLDEQERTHFRYAYSVYQVEYSRNLLFKIGAQMEQVFDLMVARTRARLDVPRVRTMFGAKQRPRQTRRRTTEPRLAVVVETLEYDLTVFKIHFGNLTLKAYTKGERVLRFEAVVHNTRDLDCGRMIERFPHIVTRLKAMLVRFMTTLDCVDVAFISDDSLDHLPLPSQVGKTRVGGVDINRPRTRTALGSRSRAGQLTNRLHRGRAHQQSTSDDKTDSIGVHRPSSGLRSEEVER